MVRRAAAVKGTRRPRKPSPPSSAGGGEDGAAEDARPQAPAKRSAAAGGFFCCYLLRSLCPRLKGRTYIGFTVNPRRRIRQHNGEISSGAWRTRRGRPWEMVLCIYGFPTNVSALQFEWAWQHPKESLAVRNAAASFKSLSGAGNKMKLAYAMLNLPSWENLNLTVNFFSSTSTKFAAGCPPLPSQMKTVVCPMEDLQCHAEAIREDHGPSSQENDINEDSQGHQGPDSLHRVEHSWNQQSSGQMQPMEAQTRTADYDVEEYDYSSDDFALMERDGILDLTEPDRSRTSPQCSLSSNSDDGHSSQEDNINEGHQARQEPPDCPRGDGHSEDSWKQLSADQVQRMDAQTSTAVYDVEEDNYSSGEFVPIERDGILDLTEPDRSRILPQCSLSSNSDDGHSSQEDNINEEPQARQGPPDCPRGDGHSKDSWKQSSNDQVQQMDMQTSTAVYDVEEDNYSSDEFVPMERDVVLDLTEPDGSRTLPQCSLSSDNDYGGVVQDELGQVSPLWKVRVSLADGGDGGDVHDELRQTSPVWKACAGSDGGVVDHELGQASPVLKVGTTYSDCGGSGFTDDELGRASPMLMVDAGSEEGERDVVVDLVTPIPVGRLRRRAGTGSICHRIIDLTASPVIIEL